MFSNYVKIPSDTIYRSLQALDEIFRSQKVYYMWVFGNHDHQLKVPERNIIEYAVSLPYCLTRENPPGHTNYVHLVQDQNNSSVLAVWGFDGSNGYPDVWGKFNLDQINYLKNASASVVSAQLNRMLPAIGFKHVPVEQFVADRNLMSGFKGLSAQPVQCSVQEFSLIRTIGGLKGLFFGHDHKNTFSGLYSGSLILAYGLKTGKAGYDSDLPLGGRIIDVIKSPEDIKIELSLIYENGTIVKDEHFKDPPVQTLRDCLANNHITVSKFQAAVTVIVCLLIWLGSKWHRKMGQNDG